MSKFITFFIVIGIILLIWKLENISPSNKKPEKNSHKNILLFYTSALIISLAAASIVYYFTESFKVAIILFVFFAVCVTGGSIKSLYSRYRKKHRRAVKQ